MINPAFIEANYEVLESLLREHRRRMRNEDLHTELEYFSEECDEEREMEPRPARAKETTPVLPTVSPRVQRQRERVVEFKNAPNRDEGRVERNFERRNSKRRGEDYKHQEVNLPPLQAAHLVRRENSETLQSSLTFIHGGHQPSINVRGNLPPNAYGHPLSYPSHAHGENPTFGGTSAYHPYEGYAPQAPTSSNIPTSNGFMYSFAAPSNNFLFDTQPILYWLHDPICLLDRVLPSTRRAKDAFSCGIL
ncbi:hypothetical protein Tco_0917958 [Tanacetum coccineum]